ncbi:MAG: hypothetical protein E7552_03310 [Ruminococcaceae bacterium]|nr:hypothetical protein [Oscillospiraceae bacterium]
MKHKRLTLSPELQRSQYRHGYIAWKILVFFFILASGSVLSFLLFLRPTYSEGEKRQLAPFPAFSLEALFSGDYFADIDTWFSDTFPLREEMVLVHGHIESLYGIRQHAVYTDNDNQFDDDVIPDIPTRPATTVSTTTATLAPYSTTVPTTTETTVTTETTAPTETTLPTDPATTTTVAPVVDTAPQTLGSILVVGNSGYEYYSFSQKAADMYVGAINRAAAALKDKATVYDILIPLAIDIVLDDQVRSEVRSADQKKAIDYIYGSMDGSVKTVDAYSALRAHRNEYLYFRTDHHWTATGAYYAYKAFGETKGTAVPALTDYQTMDFDGYLGTLYNKTGKVAALGNTPDTVRAYLPLYPTSMQFTDRKGNTMSWPVVKDVSTWKKGSLYSTFIGGDNPFTKIHNDALSDGSSCVVVKESFGNAFVPFLVSHYETVYVVDYRYYQDNFINFVIENGVDDVIFINNMSATRSTNLMTFIEDLIPVSE